MLALIKKQQLKLQVKLVDTKELKTEVEVIDIKYKNLYLE